MKMQSVYHLEVKMCCLKCEEKLLEEYWELPGLSNVVAFWKESKVVVTALPEPVRLDKDEVLKRARKIDRNAKFVEVARKAKSTGVGGPANDRFIERQFVRIAPEFRPEDMIQVRPPTGARPLERSLVSKDIINSTISQRKAPTTLRHHENIQRVSDSEPSTGYQPKPATTYRPEPPTGHRLEPPPYGSGYEPEPSHRGYYRPRLSPTAAYPPPSQDGNTPFYFISFILLLAFMYCIGK
ncbi:hypothetical protein KC19_11G035000 [Ceratodon purpureus]|uniref:Uncharacterized protein n=1 Tax=Ceratodon purpureus TaxID=3225 RepID=A0A8T0GEF4_CERPU|nr:hypothetical protein KC19_11G035000 [Ceratodon purpureus]